MYKKRLLSMLLVLCFMFTISSVAFADNDDYPDSFDAASYIPANTDINGAINYSGDSDYFMFTAPQTAMYMVTSNSSNNNIIGTVYNSSYQLWYSQHNLYNPCHLAAGSVIFLKMDVNNSTTGSYTIRITSLPDDHGDVFADATEVTVDTDVTGWFNFDGDIDYFKFTVERDGTYLIRTTGNTDTRGYLYDSNYNLLAVNDNITSTDLNFYIFQDLTAGQTCYVRIDSPLPGTQSSYTFRVWEY